MSILNIFFISISNIRPKLTKHLACNSFPRQSRPSVGLLVLLYLVYSSAGLSAASAEPFSTPSTPLASLPFQISSSQTAKSVPVTQTRTPISMVAPDLASPLDSSNEAEELSFTAFIAISPSLTPLPTTLSATNPSPSSNSLYDTLTHLHSSPSPPAVVHLTVTRSWSRLSTSLDRPHGPPTPMEGSISTPPSAISPVTYFGTSLSSISSPFKTPGIDKTFSFSRLSVTFTASTSFSMSPRSSFSLSYRSTATSSTSLTLSLSSLFTSTMTYNDVRETARCEKFSGCPDGSLKNISAVCITGRCSIAVCCIVQCPSPPPWSPRWEALNCTGSEVGAICSPTCATEYSGTPGRDMECLPTGSWSDAAGCDPDHCADGLPDQEETTIDCGGSCDPCPVGGVVVTVTEDAFTSIVCDLLKTNLTDQSIVPQLTDPIGASELVHNIDDTVVILSGNHALALVDVTNPVAVPIERENGTTLVHIKDYGDNVRKAIILLTPPETFFPSDLNIDPASFDTDVVSIQRFSENSEMVNGSITFDFCTFVPPPGGDADILHFYELNDNITDVTNATADNATLSRFLVAPCTACIENETRGCVKWFTVVVATTGVSFIGKYIPSLNKPSDVSTTHEPFGLRQTTIIAIACGLVGAAVCVVVFSVLGYRWYMNRPPLIRPMSAEMRKWQEEAYQSHHRTTKSHRRTDTQQQPPKPECCPLNGNHPTAAQANAVVISGCGCPAAQSNPIAIPMESGEALPAIMPQWGSGIWDQQSMSFPSASWCDTPQMSAAPEPLPPLQKEHLEALQQALETSIIGQGGHVHSTPAKSIAIREWASGVDGGEAAIPAQHTPVEVVIEIPPTELVGRPVAVQLTDMDGGDGWAVDESRTAQQKIPRILSS